MNRRYRVESLVDTNYYDRGSNLGDCKKLLSKIKKARKDKRVNGSLEISMQFYNKGKKKLPPLESEFLGLLVEYHNWVKKIYGSQPIYSLGQNKILDIKKYADKKIDETYFDGDIFFFSGTNAEYTLKKSKIDPSDLRDKMINYCEDLVNILIKLIKLKSNKDYAKNNR